MKKNTESLPRSLRSRGHFRAAVAKFWNSSIFHRFLLENFHCFAFQGRLTSASSEWALWMFSKITFLKSVHSKEKDKACLGFLEEIFTKSVHRGGVCSRASKAPFSTALTRESKIGEWWNYNQVFLGCALVGAAFSQYFRPSVCLS